MGVKDIQEYRQELHSVAEALKPCATVVEIRGSGLAQFVFVDKPGKSLELSWCENGIWGEFWKNDSEHSAYEKIFRSYDHAIQAAREWLTTEESEWNESKSPTMGTPKHNQRNMESEAQNDHAS